MARTALRHVLLRELETLVLERKAELPGLRLQRILNGLREIDEMMEIFVATQVPSPVVAGDPLKENEHGPDQQGGVAGSAGDSGAVRHPAAASAGVAAGRTSGPGRR